MHYTAAHWGIYEVDHTTGTPRLAPFGRDPEPTPIGLDQLDARVTRLRVARPAVRRSWLERGPGLSPLGRGREPFVEVPWDEALDLVAAELARVRRDHGDTAIFGGSYGWSSAGRFHHAQSQVHRFLAVTGGYVSNVDTYSLAAGPVILPYVAGSLDELRAEQSSWDVMAEHTRLLVAFGGMPAKNAQVSPGGAGDHMLRQGLERMAAAGTRFVNVSPVRDSLDTGGEVEWIPIRPGTDAALMLAMTRVLLKEGLADHDFLARCCIGTETLAAYLSGESDGIEKTPAWAEAITGVPAERINRLAREIAGTRSMLGVAFSLQRAEFGEQPFFAVIALAAAAGQIGRPGGGFGFGYGAMNMIGSAQYKLKGPTLPQGSNPVRDFIPVARIADMLLNPGGAFTYRGADYTYPDIRMIYWAGGNPYHHHQDLTRLRRAWEKPETIVVHEQYWTATAKLADIVLPATTALERDDIGFASLERYLVAMRRVAAPHAEARDDYDIFRGLARRLDAEDLFTEGRDADAWLRRLYADCTQRAAADGVDLPDFDRFWAEGLVDLAAHARPRSFLAAFRRDPAAAPLATPSGRIELSSDRLASYGLADCPSHPAWIPPTEWLGTAEADELHLVSDQPARRLHSQLDHSAYSVAGKQDGREYVTISPSDAAARGIADGDVVELWNARGRCLAAARVSGDIMPGVLRLSTGAWFDPFAEDGLDAQGNPNVLTRDIGASSLSQGCSAQTCLVRIARVEGVPAEPRSHEPPPFAARGAR